MNVFAWANMRKSHRSLGKSLNKCGKKALEEPVGLQPVATQDSAIVREAILSDLPYRSSGGNMSMRIAATRFYTALRHQLVKDPTGDAGDISKSIE